MLVFKPQGTPQLPAMESISKNDFLLTVLVIDEYGEGIPVAWLLPNKENTVLMEFLKEVRRTSGYLAPKWFMSDDANQFF